jgi:hypothetical protein
LFDDPLVLFDDLLIGDDDLLVLFDDLLAGDDDLLVLFDDLLIGDDDLLVLFDDLLVLFDDPLVKNDDPLVLPDDLLATFDEPVMKRDDLLVLFDDLLALFDDLLVLFDDPLVGNDDLLVFLDGPVAPLAAGSGLDAEAGRGLFAVEELLEGVAQAAVRDDVPHAEAHVDDGLGDLGVDAGDDALGAEEADRLGHADEVVGGLGVHHLDAGEVEDGATGPRGLNGAEEGVGHVGAARRVHDADDGEAEDAVPHLHDGGGEVADGAALLLDGVELLLQLGAIALVALLLGLESPDHLVDAAAEGAQWVRVRQAHVEALGEVAVGDVRKDHQEIRDLVVDLGHGLLREPLRARRPFHVPGPVFHRADANTPAPLRWARTAVCAAPRIQESPPAEVRWRPKGGCMRSDWIIGLGALSTLAVLVGIDLLLVTAEDRGRAVLRKLAAAPSRHRR